MYTIYDVAVDNFIDVFLIYIGVPNTFRIHHTHWSLLTTVKTSGLVDAHLALPGHAQLLYPAFCIVTQYSRSALIAGRTLSVRPTIVGTEKQVSLEVPGHWNFRLLFTNVDQKL
jgi:hypothetical protein